jgi:hypothetical protein
MNLLRQLFKMFLFLLYSSCQKVLLRAVKFLIILTPGKISVSYYSGNQFDGTGAQLQRLASVYALSKYLGIDFIKTPLSGVTVHPTDPFRSENDYNQYLIRVGNFLQLDADNCDNPNPNCKSINLSIISASSLLRIVALNAFQRSRIHLKVFQANSIIDNWPELIPNFVKVNKNEITIAELGAGRISIAIHYRQGAGGFPVYPGQKLSRQIDLDVYTKILKKLINELPEADTISITVFTDSPQEESSFTPPEEQLTQWLDTPGFDGKRVLIIPTDFQPIMSFASNRVTVSIEHGGDPLDAFKFMTQADVLIMSRSSLSYLAGLLNLNGTVYFPVNFWHSPLRSWKKFRDG